MKPYFRPATFALALSVAGAGVGAQAVAPALPAKAAATCNAEAGYSAVFGGRRTFFLNPVVMEALKRDAATDPALMEAKKALVARADAALARGPYAVTQKRVLPPSGKLQDYLSIAPYWWPDPAKKNGIPYIRKDGEINPDRDSPKYDLARLEAMRSDVETLGFAYYFTDDARYAAHAAKLVRVWFIDSKTRMNPNLSYAQAVPGREEGRAEGIIDTRRLQGVIEAIGLIGPAQVLSADEQASLERWYSEYSDWLMTSRLGKEEGAAANNHALWYDSQLAQFALFARRPDVTKRIASAFVARRITPQFADNGSLPKELARTRSLHYSVFALAAAYDVADLGQCVGVVIWNRTDAKGRGLRKATDFLAPYAGQIARWPYPELRPDADPLNDLLVRAAAQWPDGGYQADPKRAAIRTYFKTRAI